MTATVTRLPTAGPRKVLNARFADQRRAAHAMRQAEPWPGEYQHPGERAATALAAEVRAIQQTPALLAVSAIVRSLDDETYRKVLEQLAPFVLGGNVAGQQALATIRASRLTVGEQLDLLAAMDRLERQEGA